MAGAAGRGPRAPRRVLTVQLPCAAAGPKQHWGTAFDSVATPIYALGEGDPNYEADEARRRRAAARAPAFQGVT